MTIRSRHPVEVWKSLVEKRNSFNFYEAEWSAIGFLGGGDRSRPESNPGHVDIGTRSDQESNPGHVARSL